jgi:hypothetical protein
MKWFLLIFLLVVNVYSEILSPTGFIKAGGSVRDMIIHDDILVVGTSSGAIEAYDLNTKEQLYKMQFSPIKDFMGDEILPKIFSVDYLKGSHKYLAVVQTSSGARELFIIDGEKKEKLITENEKLFISKAKFVDEKRVMVALLSNEYILLDTQNKKQFYRLHASFSRFSDFMLNSDKTLLVGSSESGKISVLDVDKGKIVKTLQGGNVDNVYKVDIKSKKVLAAGQDRRGIVYDLDTEEFSRFDAHFLIYAGALSPSAALAAFAFTEENDIVIFDLKMDEKIHTLKGQKSTLNSIVFKNEKELVSASGDKQINIWRLP